MNELSADEDERGETPPPIPTPRISLTELERVESAGDQLHCLVCYSELSHPGIVPCNHNEICGVCHLRLRHLHGNKQCPICKEEHEKIIVDVPGKTFDEYPMWGDELGNNYVFRKNVGMFFPTQYFATEVEPLFGYQCTQPGCPYDGTVPDENPEEAEAANGDGNNNNQQGNRRKKKKPPTPLKALQDHLRTKHKLALCTLCIDHKRDFVALLPRMAPYQLKKHLTKGDGAGSGFEGHPVCEFCRPKRFYDLASLHVHLSREHYKCHVCEKQGLQNQYFRNYSSLERHFAKAHFPCLDYQCVQARFVVFENEIDLQAHERQVHGTSSGGSSKIQLEFRTRRAGHDGSGLEQRRQEVPSEEDFNYGLQGEAFVPAALPQTDDLTLHPLHLRRTAEFRAQAAQIRAQQERENQGASFPTLQDATAGTEAEAGAAGQGPLNIGWTSSTTVQRVAGRKKNAGAVTENDFPALPSSGPPKSAATAKLKAGPSGNRQFAAMRATAAQPVPASQGWGGTSRPAAAPAAPAPASYQYNSAAFPPATAAHASMNRTENLAPDNFPALGGGTKKSSRAGMGLSGRPAPKQQTPPSWNSAVDFPAPMSSSAPAPKKAAAPASIAPAPVRTPPSLNSQMDFPPPPSASSGGNSVKQRVMGNQKQPSKAAMANVLQSPQASFATPANPKDTLQDMQASLGPAKYKKLKKFTREFAEDDLTPDAFIDHAASLFDKGYGDPDFWKTIPALVSSCPNESSAKEALRYMESLRHNMKAPPTPTPVVAPSAPPSTSWGSASLDIKPEDFPAPSAASARGSGPRPAAAVPRSAVKPTTRYVVPSGKKKNAWGGAGGTAASVMQAKKTPASVAAAAAQQGPQGGSATKFMAKQTKQQQQQQNQLQKSNQKKKKKEKEELRNLAFGR